MSLFVLYSNLLNKQFESLNLISNMSFDSFCKICSENVKFSSDIFANLNLHFVI